MQNRRNAIQHTVALAGLLAASGFFPELALAYSKDAFEAKNIADALKGLGVGPLKESKDVTINGPDIAENGAVVPVAVATTLSGVKAMLIMIEKNPASLSAMFNVGDNVEPAFSARVKMGQTSDVYAAAVMADNSVLFAKKEIKVTLGGCGG